MLRFRRKSLIWRCRRSNASGSKERMRKFFLLFLILAACTKTEAPPAGNAAQSGGTITINGAGATFPYPIYSKWFSDYNKLHPNVQINYQSIGSGGGLKQFISQTVVFRATEGPMND